MSALLRIPGFEDLAHVTETVLSLRTIGIMLSTDGGGGRDARTILLTPEPPSDAMRATWGPDVGSVATNKEELVEALTLYLREERLAIDPCPFPQFILRPAPAEGRMGRGVFRVGASSVFLADLELRRGEKPGEALTRRLIESLNDLNCDYVPLFDRFGRVLEDSRLNPNWAPGAALPAGFEEEFRACLYAPATDRFCGESLKTGGWQIVAAEVGVLIEAYRTALLDGDLANYAGTPINGRLVRELVPQREMRELGQGLRRARQALMTVRELAACFTQLSIMGLAPIHHLYALANVTGASISLAGHQEAERLADTGNTELGLPAPLMRSIVNDDGELKLHLQAFEKILRAALTPRESWDQLGLNDEDKVRLATLVDDPARIERLRSLAQVAGLEKFIADEVTGIEEQLRQPPSDGLSLDDIRTQSDQLAGELLFLARQENTQSVRLRLCESKEPKAISDWAFGAVEQIASAERAAIDSDVKSLNYGLRVIRNSGLETEQMLMARIPRDGGTPSSLTTTPPSNEFLAKLTSQLENGADANAAYQCYQATVGMLSEIADFCRNTSDVRARGKFRRFLFARWIESHRDSLEPEKQDGWLYAMTFDLVEHSENGAAALLKEVNPKNWIPPQYCVPGWLMRLRQSMDATFTGATQNLFPWQGQIRPLLKLADELPADRQLLLFCGSASAAHELIERSVFKSHRPTWKAGQMTNANESLSLAFEKLIVLPSALANGANSFIDRMENLKTSQAGRGYSRPLLIFGTGGLAAQWHVDGRAIGARLDNSRVPGVVVGPSIPLDWGNDGFGPCVPAPLVIVADELGVDLGLEACSVEDHSVGRFRVLGVGTLGLKESVKRLKVGDDEYCLLADLRALAILRVLNELKHMRYAMLPPPAEIWPRLRPYVTRDQSSTRSHLLTVIDRWDGIAPRLGRMRNSALTPDALGLIVGPQGGPLDPKKLSRGETSMKAGWLEATLGEICNSNGNDGDGSIEDDETGGQD